MKCAIEEIIMTCKSALESGKAISKRCRNHGGCAWRRENRLHKHKKAAMKGE